jgi:aromatic-L-amino-acid/L-tryptophan decarboxylase
MVDPRISRTTADLATLTLMSTPLEPGKQEREALNEAILSFLDDWYEAASTMNASGVDFDPSLVARLAQPPTEDGRSMTEILGDLEAAGQSGTLHPSGGHLAYIPNAGLYTGALAEFLAAGLNRYTGVAAAAPGMSAIEHGVIAWMTAVFDLGEKASGLMLSGASMANFTAIVAARTSRLGDDLTRGVLYVSPHTHHSVAKAARLAGFRDDQIRTVAVDAELRMDPDALASSIAEDRASGRQPFLVVGSAGTTDTGTVDPLRELARICSDGDLWFHIDGAYGGFFRLTDRGRERLTGIERADSIAIDPHKGLSMPFGSGALLVRDETHLIDANHGRGAYLLAEDSHAGLRDISALGPELTRPFRGLQVWLPLQLHGVAPFREALDDSLDLAQVAYDRLAAIQGIEAPWRPDLSIVAFRFEDDAVGRAAMEAINQDRVVHVSPTIVDERFVLRFAILNRRTTLDHIDHAIDIIEKTLIG